MLLYTSPRALNSQRKDMHTHNLNIYYTLTSSMVGHLKTYHFIKVCKYSFKRCFYNRNLSSVSTESHINCESFVHSLQVSGSLYKKGSRKPALELWWLQGKHSGN